MQQQLQSLQITPEKLNDAKEKKGILSCWHVDASAFKKMRECATMQPYNVRVQHDLDVHRKMNNLMKDPILCPQHQANQTGEKTGHIVFFRNTRIHIKFFFSFQNIKKQSHEHNFTSMLNVHLLRLVRNQLKLFTVKKNFLKIFHTTFCIQC